MFYWFLVANHIGRPLIYARLIIPLSYITKCKHMLSRILQPADKSDIVEEVFIQPKDCSDRRY